MHTVGLAVTEVWQNRPERYDPYRRWLEQAPFQVRLVQRPEDLDGVEALILPGGHDVAPERYGAPNRHPERTHVEPIRDAEEFALLERADRENLPILGICRGHQVLNVYYGGTLIQDVPLDFPPARQQRVRHDTPRDQADTEHVILFAPDLPRRYRISPHRLVCVNSRHHQAVLRVSFQLHVGARSTDGLVEMVYHPGKRFVLGIQWHPERMSEHEVSRSILQRLHAVLDQKEAHPWPYS